MKTRFQLLFTFLVLLGSLSSLNAQSAKKFTLDKDHTSINFSITHFFSSVPGRFKTFDGTLNFDEKNLANSSASFTISVPSVNTDNEKRDTHLQTEDFFDAKKYQNITFTSTSFKKKSENLYLVTGKLTIKDVTKTVILPMKITGLVDNPWVDGSVILGVSIETSIDRTNYGVGTGSWAASTVVGDEVKISINMEWDGKK
jgi:polyisoprenoid-binding protein YceI